jgi:SAM-dependent methyltransferase
MVRPHIYDKLFYDYISAGSTNSARVVVPIVMRSLSPASVLDIGCGAGAWLAQYSRAPLSDYLGIDGSYVTPESLLIPQPNFQPRDISRDFDLGRTFDLVQCLEVAEHLPPAASETLVGNLVRHGDKILFSAAVPGQGGENHINEQSYEFWRQAFARHGYEVFDCIRPAIQNHPQVESWYRYNLLLYVHQRGTDALPQAVKQYHVPAGRPVADVSPLAFRMRKSLLNKLSPEAVSKIATLKHRIHVSLRLRTSGEK